MWWKLMVRCFVAVNFSSEITEKMSQLQATARAIGLDATFPKHLHCTLAFLGDLSQTEIETVKQKLDKITSKPVETKVNGVGFFPNEKFVKVFWVGVEGLDKLQKEVSDTLKHTEKEPFKAHVTLARIKTQKNLGQVKKLYEDNKNTLFGVETTSEIVLYESKPSSTGPAYTPVFTKKLS